MVQWLVDLSVLLLVNITEVKSGHLEVSIKTACMLQDSNLVFFNV